jgi:predicted enzyme related to lactoylglutathione lyase
VETLGLFAAVPVTAFKEAVDWYSGLFGRDADVIAHDREVMWQVSTHGWLYVLEDGARAGQTVVTLSVPDLNEAVEQLESRGIGCGPIEPVGDAGLRARATDPEGNVVALVQVPG